MQRPYRKRMGNVRPVFILAVGALDWWKTCGVLYPGGEIQVPYTGY